MDWQTRDSDMAALIRALEARATAAEAREAKLREALDNVPIPGKHEHADHFYARMELWLNGPYRQARAALETDNG